uniref:Chemokine interleukin-8-like domain-containing protein n=1 Tax=Poecilia reticulata TaxID=8081 RepID=A0A3P9QDX6_POERE
MHFGLTTRCISSEIFSLPNQVESFTVTEPFSHSVTTKTQTFLGFDRSSDRFFSCLGLDKGSTAACCLFKRSRASLSSLTEEHLVIMKAANILLLCILGAALLSSVLCNSGNTPVDCCFDFFKNTMNKNLFSSYYKTDPRCSLSGIVLITKRGRSICADAKQPWVKTITDFLGKNPR